MGQTVDYEAVLADLEARRADLDTMIAGVKVLLGQSRAEAATGQGGTPAPPAGQDLPKEVAPGVFHGMSVSEAAKTFLEMTKTKQKTRAIAEALMLGGIESDSQNFDGNVYTTLQRNRAVFARRGKYWGLTQWYPTKAGAGVATKPAKKARRVKKGKKAQTSSASDKQKVLPMTAGGEKAQTA